MYTLTRFEEVILTAVRKLLDNPTAERGGRSKTAPALKMERYREHRP